MSGPGDDGSAVGERLARLRAAIATTCARCGRDPAAVTLVGVSKRQPVARIRAALTAGLEVLGESRVQEAAAKQSELAAPGVSWHLIGPLQSNKARLAVSLFDTIHSVDRLKIAAHIEREAAAQGRRIDGFIQVNVGDEASKHGFAADDLIATLQPLTTLQHLRLVGLMAIPPYEEDPQAVRPYFRQLRELRDALQREPAWADFPGWLSMGMSHDFAVAIEEGATHVRVGTNLFGSRS